MRRGLGLVLGLAVGTAGLVLSARGVDRAALMDAFRHVSWWWICAAAAANVLNIAAFGWAWRIGLDAGGAGPVAIRHAVAATWIGKAGNQLLPGKVGEVARVALIRSHIRPDRREISRIAGTVVAQRALYIVATLIAVVLTTALAPLPVAVPGGRWAPGLTLAVVAVVAVLARTLRFPGGSRWSGRWWSAIQSFVGGAGLLRPSRHAAAALGFHLVAVFAQLTTYECLLRGFAVAAPPTAPLLIIALVGLVGAVPGAPGGVGLNQAALVAPLGAAYGVTPSAALAFALGLQATLASVAVAGGAVALLHQRRAPATRAAFP